MLPNTLAELLKLSAGERAEIAMALWESLTDAEREAETYAYPRARSGTGSAPGGAHREPWLCHPLG